MGEFENSATLPDIWYRKVGRFTDERGFFQEITRISDLPVNSVDFIQDSVSFSKRNILRGMHFQDNQWQLVTLLKGYVQDVILCVDRNSSNFQSFIELEMKEDGVNQILLPPGYAHGFANIGEEAIMHYKSNIYYGSTPQHGIHWQSKVIIDVWIKKKWIMSSRDLNFSKLENYE